MIDTDAKIENPQTLEQWTRVLCDQEMPIFSNTAQNIYSSLESSKKGAMELASVILQDPNLTAKLLKVSNSVHYNPSKQKMSTISRAFVILGANVVRELTIACSFFESIISPENKHQANKEIANAIHAAVQAKEIAIACNDSSPEEVFIATLLNNIGPITFWCFGGKQCQYISDLLQTGNYTQEQAETKVLGFTLDELGKGLCKSWNLGGLIEQAIDQPDSPNNRIQTINLAKQVTQAIAEGWDSEAMTVCLNKLETLTGLDTATSKALLKKNTASAVNIAGKFGAHDASQFIQRTPEAKKPVTTNNNITDKSKIQFHILQDITQHLSGSININFLLEMVVEGIHRGLDMDRSLLCILSPDKKTLNEKLAIGWNKDLNAAKIKLEVSDFPANLFFKALDSNSAFWAKPIKDRALYTPSVINNVGKSECFLIPIHTSNNPIGLIYTDCSIDNKPLTQEDFKVAKHFTQQANIGLALYKMNSDK